MVDFDSMGMAVDLRAGERAASKQRENAQTLVELAERVAMLEEQVERLLAHTETVG